MDWLAEFLNNTSYLGLLLALLACGLGLPVPEDIILITGGVLAHPDTHHLVLTVVVCMVGVMGGDLIIFSLGHHFGKRILRLPPFRWLLTPRRLKSIRAMYQRYGYRAIFLSRFLAGIRAGSFLMAGISQVPFRTFILSDGLAAMVSVPFLVVMGYIFAEDIEHLIDQLKRVEHGVVATLLIVALLYLGKRFIYNPLRDRITGEKQA